MDWKQLLVYISGSVEEELLLRIEYAKACSPTRPKRDSGIPRPLHKAM
jgi:hypothetical protein